MRIIRIGLDHRDKVYETVKQPIETKKLGRVAAK